LISLGVRTKWRLIHLGPCLALALASPTLSAVPKPTPTPGIASRIHAYRVAHPGVLEVGGGVSEPRELSRVKPEYPETALKQPLSLKPIVVIAVITEEGAVSDPVLVGCASPELDAAFMKAVRQWRYEPARLKGKPVAAFLTVTVMWHF
jgi:TonB family protein